MNGGWWLEAACRDAPAGLFYARDVFSQRVALRVCSGCQVCAECLADTLEAEAGQQYVFGVRGALTAAQRRALAR